MLAGRLPTSSREIIEVKFNEVDNDEQVLAVERGGLSLSTGAHPRRAVRQDPRALVNHCGTGPGARDSGVGLV